MAISVEIFGMGNCVCKDGSADAETCSDQYHAEGDNTIIPFPTVGAILRRDAGSSYFEFEHSANVDKLVLETLGVIASLVDK